MARDLKKEYEGSKIKYERIEARIDKETGIKLKSTLNAKKISIATWIEDNAKKFLENKEESKMKLIDVKNFDYENRKGEEIWCVEHVSNNAEETGHEIYECANEEEAIRECEEYNRANHDKNYKYIVVRYLIESDGLMCV